MTLQQQNWPFRYRVLFLTTFIALSVSIALGLPLTNSSSQTLKAQSLELKNSLTQQASSQAADAIFSQDLVSLNVMLSTLVDNPQVAYAGVYNLENHIVAEQGVLPQNVDNAPVRLLYQDQMIGSFQLLLDPAPLSSAITRLYSQWAILTILFTSLAGLLGWQLGLRLGQKLDLLSQQLNGLADHQFDTDTFEQGELKTLSHGLRQHALQQKAQQDMDTALARFTRPPNTHIDIVHHEQYHHAAVLFIDFVDFDRTAEQLRPSEMADLLNQYHFFISQAARLYNGTVDKYVGDGIMVLFGVPQHDEKDCFHGVCTALLLTGLLYEFNAKRQQKHLPTLDFKMGLHTGAVLTGVFGDSEQPQYSVIGSTLHQAARLCRKSHAQRVLVSQDVIDAGRLTTTLTLEHAFDLKADEPGKLLACHWVNDLAPNYRTLIQRQIQHISAQNVDEIG